MLIKTFILGSFQQNTRIVVCEDTGRAICVDPAAKSTELIEFVNDNNLHLQAIALTHGHLDHIGGTSDLCKSFPQVEILLHQDDEPLYYGLPEQPLMLGIPDFALASLGMKFEKPPELTRNWIDGERYQVGSLKFKVLHCPGHTPGHVVLVEERNKKIFVGDCLFRGSIGRTDLPGGSYEQLIETINEKILTFGDDFAVYSGHGPETTIGYEKATNPFLTGDNKIGRGSFV